MPIQIENRPNVFYNTKEVARIMETTVFSVIKWIGAGKLKAAKVGKGYRIPEKAVHNFLSGKINQKDE